MTDFFDQGTGREESTDRDIDGASVLVNGSHQPLEVGASFVPALQTVARQAGFGKFKVWLNGVEVKPSSIPAEIRPNDKVELRPYDEAGC